jgi:hypothetical protein
MERSDAPVPCMVEYSDLVLRHLRLLAKEASVRGDGPVFAAAMKEFDRLLRLYPQFGDPQINLTEEPGVIHLGIVPPLSMRYGVYEERRLVLVVALPILLPMAKPDEEAKE